MTSIGDRLRQERLRRGLDIHQLAEQTKINASMLEAIEADDLEKLPGSFFTRSFIRQYARALGLDDEEFDSELRRLTAAEQPPVSADTQFVPETSAFSALPVEKSPAGSSRHSLGALIAFVLVMAVASLLYTLWQRTRGTGRLEEAPAAEIGKPPEPPSESAPAAARQPPAAESASPRQETQSASAQPRAASEAPAPASPAGQSPAATAEPEAVSPVPAGETAAIRVEVHATGVAWIRAVADGTTLYSGILQPNESKSFEGKAQMSLRIGDPGAAQVTWNGKPVGEIGPAGQPRTVRFTPEGFKVLATAPPKPPDESGAL
jgi:cytoskeleton protein RodZ